MGRRKKDETGSSQLDLFVSDVTGWYPKSDRHTLEHPFFSLSKRKDIKPRRYESPDGSEFIEITPSVMGLATIWDKDLLIYAASLLKDKLNRGEKVENQYLSLLSYNFLTATNRGTGGNSYAQLEAALDRLKGTMVKTSIMTGGTRKTRAFSLIDGWEIIEKNKKLIKFEIKLSDWYYDAIVSNFNEMLAIDQDYFKIESGVERRLYEMTRKHCGQQPQWSVFVKTLHAKSGATCSSKEFRRILREIVKKNAMPDYLMSYDENADKITFYSRNFKGVIPALVEEKAAP